MLHLDYILYVILIILVFILINKVFFKEIINEGFEHKGKGFIAAKPKTDEEKEGKEKPDSNMIIATKISYKTAEQVAYILIKMENGKIENSKFVEIIQSKEMEIFSDEKIIHLDGEPKKINKSVLVKNNPKTLKILIPNE